MGTDYIQQHEGYFWKWASDGEVLEIPNGNTIAYKSQVADILENLAEQGLPRFGSLLLVMTAMNPNAKSSLEQIYNILVAHKPDYTDPLITEAMKLLYWVREIPDAYKIGHKKIYLLRDLFKEGHDRLSLQHSRKTKEMFRATAYHLSVNSRLDALRICLEKDLRVLGIISKRYNSADDIISNQLSIPEIDEEVELEEAPLNETGDLIEELINHPKTQRIGSLVKFLWSGLALPFYMKAPSDQSMGGVSDLTNKGKLSQLLISEYANEDIIFLSRLANHEALYLNREAPPSSQNQKRTILIDISIKNWGIPKTMAFACMLALTRHPKTKLAYSVFVIGEGFEAVEVDSLDTILEAIQHVDVTLTPAQGISQYFLSHPPKANEEVVLLTERTTILHPDMHRLLADRNTPLSYWMLLDEEGGMDVFRKLYNGKRHLQRMELPLEELWKIKKQPTQNTTFREKSDHDFFPMLIKPNQNVGGYRESEYGEIFQISREHHLLRFYDRHAHGNNRGWQMVYYNLPIKEKHFDFGVGHLSKGGYAILVLEKDSKRMTLVNTRTGQTVRGKYKYEYRTDKPNIIFHEDLFYIYGFGSLRSVDLEGNMNDAQERQKHLLDKFQAHEEKVVDINKRLRSYFTMFKNLRKISINNGGNLMFNQHELKVLDGQHVKLKTNRNFRIQASARMVHEDLFEFSDGSTIENTRAGMFILTSSNPDIPQIYVPSALNTSMALATREIFSGQSYFFQQPLFQVVIKQLKPEVSKKELLNTLKGFDIENEEGLNHLTKTFPFTLPKLFRHGELQTLNRRLGDIEAEFEYIPCNKEFDKNQSYVLITEFFRRYLNPFIQHILDHGTDH
ncbi:MAG: hypothetical protein AAFY71_14830 [Bacteroidota bacterium]